MVSIATFGPRDPGSNPGWFAVSNSKLKIEFSRIIKIYSTLASTAKLQSEASL